MYGNFEHDIVKMNAMYELRPIEGTLAASHERLKKFSDILKEECRELEEIDWNTIDPSKAVLDIRVQLADLLGDLIVYCASEAKRWNIPLASVLEIIMESNFSKLGEDGKPIKDSRGKFLKGPNYWKPEPKIEQLLLTWQESVK